jgi:type II secretory pathway pseudopilin PulG
MDIHKPKPWRGVREFLKEYVIIVVGVLTALAGEQVVEQLHRSEEARLAERAMRLELGQDDGQQAYARVLITRCSDDRIAQIHDGAFGAPADQLRKWTASYVPPFRSWDSEAWKAVVSSDIGKFMGAERLVDWSAAYRTMPGLSELNAHESEPAAELRDALPPSGEPSGADRQNLRRLAGLLRLANDRMSRGSELFLVRTRRLDATVAVATQQTLLSQARALYGDCAVAPDLLAPAAAGDPRANLLGILH